jgi:hypothetical protein
MRSHAETQIYIYIYTMYILHTCKYMQIFRHVHGKIHEWYKHRYPIAYGSAMYKKRKPKWKWRDICFKNARACTSTCCTYASLSGTPAAEFPGGRSEPMSKLECDANRIDRAKLRNEESNTIPKIELRLLWY